MATSSAAVTVRTVLPWIPDPWSVAVIVAAPAATDVVNTSLPPAFETVAVAGADDAHVTESVRSWTEASVKVPVATNGWVVPSAIDGLVGVTAIETSEMIKYAANTFLGQRINVWVSLVVFLLGAFLYWRARRKGAPSHRTERAEAGSTPR